MPTTMSDPLHDTHPTRQRISATVPAEHELNLTLPCKPPKCDEPQAFAIVSMDSSKNFNRKKESVMEALAMGSDFGVTFTARVWCDIPGYRGTYVSLRGNPEAIRHAMHVIGCSHVVHGSAEFSS